MLFTHFKAKGNVGIINDNLPIKRSIFTEISNPMNDRDYNPLERQNTPRRTRGDLMRKLQILRKHDARPAPYYSNNLKATHKRRLDAYARLEERTKELKARLAADLARANEVIKAQEAGGLSACESRAAGERETEAKTFGRPLTHATQLDRYHDGQH